MFMASAISRAPILAPSEGSYTLADLPAAGSYFSVMDTQDYDVTNLQDFTFKPDGTAIFLRDGNGSTLVYTVTEVTLTTPWNLSSGTKGDVLDPSGDVGTGGNGLAFSPDGTKMFVRGTTNIGRYDLSTPWDLSTATFTHLAAIPGQRYCFSPDGTVLITQATTTTFKSYILSTPWDLTTATEEDTLTVSSQGTAFLCADTNPAGTKMVGVDNSNDTIFEYDLSTPFDLSTAAYNSVSFAVGGIGLDTPRAARWGKNGNNFYVVSNGFVVGWEA